MMTRSHPDTVTTLGPALDFLRLLWEVDHRLLDHSAEMLRTTGVTGPQRLVLRIVGRTPGVTLGWLAEYLGTHPSTATGLVKRLARNGLLRTVRDRADARLRRVFLTAKGRRIAARAGTIEAAILELQRRVSPRRMAAVRTVLEQFREILKR